MTQHPLGRNLEHDPLSRNFTHPLRLVRPRSVYHTLHGPHLDQGQLGSCEGNTAAEFLNTAKALKNRRAFNDVDGTRSARYLDQGDAVRLYGSATQLDDDGIPGVYPPEDTGTSGVGIAKAMQAAGALVRYDWTFTWDGFLAALQTQPVMLGTNWTNSMFYTDSKGFVHPRGSAIGGHAYLAYVLDYHHGRVGCTNHWVNGDGTPWGRRIGGHDGSFWISFADLEELLIHQQGDSLVPVLM